MEEATAMIAAANRVVQDPSQVGSGLRTISLRLRGTSVKGELEELGEDTEGLVSSSKMRDKVMGLTGVDILTDTGAYKSTYEIIKEIGHVWEGMSDVNHAALLELMAGKNRSNIMAALLTNMEDLEGAYETAMNAEGSAYRENQAYLDSIQGRVDLFMNALQTFWMNLISSDLAKGVVDFGTQLVQLLDTAHGKLLAVGAAVGVFFKVTKKIDLVKDVFSAMSGVDIPKSTTSKVVDVVTKTTVNGAASAKVFVADFATSIQKNATGLGISKAISANIMDVNTKINMRNAMASALGVKNISEIGELTGAQKKQALQAMETAAANQNLSKAQTQAMIAASGLSKATTATTFAMRGLSGVISFLGGPIGAAITAATLLAIALDKVVVTAEEASKKTTEAFNEIADVVDSTKSQISSIENEIDSLDEQISDIEGKTLTFTDSEELERLKQQRNALEGSLELQERLLESQKEVAATQAAAAMEDFMKATSATGDEAKKTGQQIGMLTGGILTIIGILAAIPTAGASLGATAAGLSSLAMQGALVTTGAILGRQAGGAIGSAYDASKISTFDDWYQTYKTAYDERLAAEQKALAKYEQDADNMDKLDAWQEAKEKTAEIQTQMYDNLSQIESYINSIDYGQGYDEILDEYYNFRDKLNIDGFDGIAKANAKGDALDRIFGENARKDIQKLGKQLRETLDDGDIDEIDLIKKVQNIPELAEQLNYLGITTDELTDYFRGAGEVGASAFWDLSDAMNDAAQAHDKITASMGNDPDANYNTRDEAIDQMNELLKAGAIGSESKLWDIAKSMGFTYKSADTIAENAAELRKWIAARDEWYHTDDSGNPTKDGAIEFAKDFESAVASSKALQNLGVEAGFDAKGNFSFDFRNKDIDGIIDALAKTDEMFGITKEEFMDQLTHLGQFIDIQWSNADDLLNYMEALGDGSASAKDQLEGLEGPLRKLLGEEGLSENEIALMLSGNGEIKGVSEDLETLIEMYRDLRDQTRDPMDLFNQDNINSAIKALEAEMGTRHAGRDTKITQEIADEIGQFADVGYNSDTQEMYVSFELLKEYAEEAGVDVDELITKLKTCGKTVHDIQITEDDLLGLESFGDDADAMIDYLDRLGVKVDEIEDKDGVVGIHLDVDSLIQTLVKAGLTEEQIQSTLTNLASKNYKFSMTDVKGEVSSVKITNKRGDLQKKFADKIKAAIQDVGAETDANVSVTESGKLIWTEDTSAISKGKDFDTTAVVTWKENQASVAKINNKSFTVDGRVRWISGNNVRVKVVKNANGTAHLPNTVLSGTANASGSWGVKKTEPSLVGELGPELVVRGDRWFTVGDNGPEFTNVRKGDIIFNHKQTEDLFKNGYVTSRGTAHAQGTAWASGTAYKIGSLVNSNNVEPISSALSDSSLELANSLTNISSAINEFEGTVVGANKIIQQSGEEQSQWYHDWFSKGNFEDGYQSGDLIKAIFGTDSDIRNDFSAGIARIGEGAIDLLATGIGGVSNALGGDKFADNTKKFIAMDLMKETGMDEMVERSLNPMSPVLDAIANLLTKGQIEENSVLGNKSDGLVQSAGQLAGTAGLQIAGVPWQVTTGITGFGSGAEKALREDASYGEAAISGAITAGAEILTEKIGGISFGGKTLAGAATDALTKGASSELGQKLAKLGVQDILLGEGTEEVFSDILSRFGEWATYKDDQTFKDMFLSKDALDSYAESWIGGVALGKGGNLVDNFSSSNNKALPESYQNNIAKLISESNDSAVKSELESFKALSESRQNNISTWIDKLLAHEPPMDKALERKIFKGEETEYADFFGDSPGIVIRDAFRTMRENFGGILSNRYKAPAGYFSNSADEANNYGKNSEEQRGIRSNLLMKNPYIVEARGKHWKALIDNNVWTPDKLEEAKEGDRAHRVVQAMNSYYWDDNRRKREKRLVETLQEPLDYGEYYQEVNDNGIDFYKELSSNKYLSEFNKIFNSKKSFEQQSELFEQKYNEFLADKSIPSLDNVFTNPNKIHEQAYAMGYDGVIIHDIIDTSGRPNDQYVVFSEDQIRSTEELISDPSEQDGLRDRSKLDAFIAQDTLSHSHDTLTEMEGIYDNNFDNYVSQNLKNALADQKNSQNNIKDYEKSLARLQSGIFSKRSRNTEDNQEGINYFQGLLDEERQRKVDIDNEVLKWQQLQQNKPSRDEFLAPYRKKLEEDLSAIAAVQEQGQSHNKDSANEATPDDLKAALELEIKEPEISDVKDELESYVEGNYNYDDALTQALQQIDYSNLIQAIQAKQQEIDASKLQIEKYSKRAAEYSESGNFDENIYAGMSNIIKLEKSKLQSLESELAGMQSKLSTFGNMPQNNKGNGAAVGNNTEYEVTGAGQESVKQIGAYWKSVPKLKKTNYIINKTTIERIRKINSSNRVNGTAHAQGTAWAGGNWGAPRTETALTGELGPELVVRGSRWFTVGENGAEFAQIQKGDIIFNHKQTEELLSNGYVTSRGKAHAQGTAHTQGTAWAGGVGALVSVDSGGNVKKSGKSKIKSKKTKEYSKDFEEVFDWFEIRIEEINEDLDLMGAKLENAISLSSKNNILDSIIATNKTQLTTLEKGLKLYNNYAAELLKKVPEKYRDEAKDGKIAIEEFAGKTDEKNLEAIKNYREWAQKAADIAQQIEETKTQIAENAKQQFDNISDRYSTLVDLQGSKKGHIEDMIDYQEASGMPVSEEYYLDLIWRTQGGTKDGITIDGQLGKLEQERAELQAQLDESVKSGDIDKYSDKWYEMVQAIHDVDSQINECNASLEEYQNAINEIHWSNFEELVNRFDYLNSEVESLIDLLGEIEKPVITPERDSGWSADEVIWSDEGLTQLGLHAEKMELAKYQADKYAEEIDYLNNQYKAGAYSETEYLEKLDELKQGQYDSIAAYNEAKDSIVELNEARVDAIKEGIEKEIEAYEELIDKKKEELDAEKDLYDFQKSVMEQQKDIATLERKLAALSSDNSASAMAKRRQLEAELAEAKQGLEETYYDRSLEDQQNALDKELENFQDEKDAEIEKLEKYLEDTEAVVADSLALVAKNSSVIYETLNAHAEEYGLTLSDAVTKPWQDGIFEMEAYQEKFSSSVISAVEQIGLIESAWQSVIDKMNEAAEAEVDARSQSNVVIESAEKTQSSNGQNTSFSNGQKVIAKKGVVAYNADGSKMFTVGYDSQYTLDSVDDKTGLAKVTTSDGRIRYFKTDELQAPTNTSEYYKKYTGKSNSVIDALKAVGVHASLENRKRIAKVNGISSYTGTAKQNKQLLDLLKKGKLKRYAKGSLGVDKDQWALINELGEELVLHAGETGKLQFLSKGSGVVPADLTSNLMDWGELNPQDVLDRNRPSIGASPEVHATEINLNIQYGDMLKIENFKGDNPDEIAKIVAKQFEKHTAQLNQSLRRYTRG